MSATFYPLAVLISLALAAAALAALPLLSSRRAPTFAMPIAITGLLIAFAFSCQWVYTGVPSDTADTGRFADLIRWSSYTPWWFFALCILLLAGFALTGFDTEPGRLRTQRLFLLTIAGIGGFSLAGASHLMVALAAWELASLPLTLAAATRRPPGAGLLSAYFADFFAFVLMALGVTLLFAQFQTLALDALFEAIQGEAQTSDILLYTGTALWLVGLLTRLGVIPFHFASGDRLLAGPLSVTAFAGIFLPVSATAFGWNLVGDVLRPILPQWQDFLSILGIATICAGALGMLTQPAWRRFVAYALMMQGGWILLAMASPGPTLEPECFLLLLANGMALATIAFGALFLESNGGTKASELAQGLLRQRPALGFAVLTGYLTLAGLPPTGGFVAKAQLLGRIAGYGMLGLALIATLATAAAGYACLRRVAPLVEPVAQPREWVQEGRSETIFFWVLAAVLWALGIVPAIAWPG